MNDKEFIVWLTGFFDGLTNLALPQGQRDMIDAIKKKIESLNKKPDLSLPLIRDPAPTNPYPEPWATPGVPKPWIPPIGSEPYRIPDVGDPINPYPYPEPMWYNPNRVIMNTGKSDDKTVIRKPTLEK